MMNDLPNDAVNGEWYCDSPYAQIQSSVLADMLAIAGYEDAAEAINNNLSGLILGLIDAQRADRAKRAAIAGDDDAVRAFPEVIASTEAIDDPGHAIASAHGGWRHLACAVCRSCGAWLGPDGTCPSCPEGA